MSLSSPDSSKPEPVTCLPLPTFAVSNCAVPPVSVTSSPLLTPVSDRPVITAERVASYSLSAAEKWPVTSNGVIAPAVLLANVTE